MSVATAPSVLVASAPWSDCESSDEVPDAGSRCCLWTKPDVTEVSVRGVRTGLPLLGEVHHRGQSWKQWELPSTSGTSPAGMVEEVLTLTLKSTDVSTVQVKIKGLPEPVGDSIVESDLIRRAGQQARSIVAGHVECLVESYDSAKPIDQFTNRAGSTAVRPWNDIIAQWRKADGTLQAPLELIVKIARDVAHTLETVCTRPRKVLRRVRQFDAADKIRQVDPACLRWLVRQPGTTIIERAGPKQRLLGIKRIELADTPENRVVRDFVIRAQRACRIYLFENRAFQDSTRVREIRRFLSQLNRLLQTTEIATVRSLVGDPQPNYVLLYDQRYQQIWHWYERLRKHDRAQEEAWRWRHRTWSEACNLALHCSLRDIQNRHLNAFHGYRSAAWIRQEQTFGQFVAANSPIGPWMYRIGGCNRFLSVVRGDQLHKCNSRDPRLLAMSALNADYVLLSHDSPEALDAETVIGVWTMMDMGVAGRSNADWVRSLRETFDRLKITRIGGLLLTPCAPSESGADGPVCTDLSNDSANNALIGFAMPPPLQQHIEWLTYAMEMLLKLDAH